MKTLSNFDYKGKPNFIFKAVQYTELPYDVAVIQWITSCHKNRMTTRVITLWRLHVTSLTRSMSTMRFLLEICTL